MMELSLDQESNQRAWFQGHFSLRNLFLHLENGVNGTKGSSREKRSRRVRQWVTLRLQQDRLLGPGHGAEFVPHREDSPG